MKEIMDIYLKHEKALESRIASSRRDITQCRTVIANAEKDIERDTETLAEIRRLMEEYR